MTIEKEYQKRVKERESVREVTTEIMQLVWFTIAKLDELNQRRALTALITELQTALKLEDRGTK